MSARLDRRHFRYFDWISFTLILILSAIGLAFVYSATYQPDGSCLFFFNKQLFRVISGFIIFAATCCADYRQLQRWGYFLYLATLVLLVFTLIKGSVGLGAQRWLNLGITKFQPSELTKLFFPAFFTYYLATNRQTTKSLNQLIPLLTVLVMSIVLILKQPDLGTAIIISLSALTLLWILGIKKHFFVYFFAGIIIASPILWKFLRPYQKQRIAVFFGAGSSHKERYQIEQSCIAIGSGGLWGKGFLRGTQNILQFLPESRTDCIFAVICEEWGFVGAMFIIIIYLLLFFRLFSIISIIKNSNTQLLAAGLVIHIVISAIINIGMVTGLLPVVGIPLPLISYGGTHSWITFASLGWFQGIAMRQCYHP